MTPQKFLFAHERSLENPLMVDVRNRTHLAWPLPSPFVRAYYVDDPKYNWKGINYPSGKADFKKIEENKPANSLICYKLLFCAYISKKSSEQRTMAWS